MMPSFVIFTKPFKSFGKPSGTRTLEAGAHDSYAGSQGRQDRFAITITNLSETKILKWRNGGGDIGGTIFPRSSIIRINSEEVQIYNPDLVESVQYEVQEDFYDEGSYNGLSEQQFQQAFGGGGGGYPGSGAGPGPGGSWGGSSGGGGGHPGTATKVN